MLLRKTAFVVVFLLVLCLSGVAAQEPSAPMPKDPLALMTVAHHQNNLTDADVKPWHIHAIYHASDAKGKPDYEGTYEEWWVSPSRYKISFSNPKFSQTDYATGTALLREGSQDWPAGPELQLRAGVVDPLFGPSLLKEFTLKSKGVNLGKVKLQCVSMTYPVRPNVEVTNEFYSARMFRPADAGPSALF